MRNQPAKRVLSSVDALFFDGGPSAHQSIIDIVDASQASVPPGKDENKAQLERSTIKMRIHTHDHDGNWMDGFEIKPRL